MKFVFFLLAATLICGCKLPKQPETQREYVASHNCKFDGYINYAGKPEHVYTEMGHVITTGGGGFTAYLCPNGVHVYIDYGN